MVYYLLFWCVVYLEFFGYLGVVGGGVCIFCDALFVDIIDWWAVFNIAFSVIGVIFVGVCWVCGRSFFDSV